MLTLFPAPHADESTVVPPSASEANSSTVLSGRASGTRERKKKPRAMITASEPIEIRYAVAPRPKTSRRTAVTAGPRTAENLPVSEKSPKNSPSFSGGERATSITRLTVHVPPRAIPTSGPARKSVQGAGAAATSEIETSHSARTARSVFLGPTQSVANPEAAEPTTAKIVEKRSRFL